MVCWAGAEVCKGCGNPLVASAQQNYGYAYAHGAPSFASDGDASNKRKGLAIASLVLGILSLPTLGLLGVGALLGITLGIFALMRAKREPSEYGGQGLAIGGIVASVLSLTLAVPIGIVAAIAIPNLLAARRAANEGSAIYNLRKLVEAESTFQATRGNGQFGSMLELQDAHLVEPVLAGGLKNSYRFRVTNLGETFEVTASPLQYPSGGTRSFYFSSSDNVIHAADKRGLSADIYDPPLAEFRTRRSINGSPSSIDDDGDTDSSTPGRMRN